MTLLDDSTDASTELHAAAPRRTGTSSAGDTPDLRRDICGRDDVEHLVRSFYRDAAVDDLLGPVFEEAGVDWPSHIDKLTDFWSWQLLGQRGYQGHPLRAHEPLHEREPFTEAHFTRWLDLFTETVDQHFAGPTAEAAKQRAMKMANALHRLLRGEPPVFDPATLPGHGGIARR